MQENNSDIFYMKLALIEAKKAFDKDEVPVGALIIDSDSKILSKSHNLVEKKHTQVAHAEVLAIKKANEKLIDWRLDNCTIYVTLEPCSMCMNLLLLSRINRLVFGASSRIFGFSIDKFNTFELYKSPIMVKEGVCQEEAVSLLKSFFKTKRNKGG